MPQELKGRIDVKCNALGLVDRPKLAARIGVICSLWTEIEDQLAFLFVLGMQTDPAIACSVLGEVVSLSVKLDMIRTALKLRFPEEAFQPFDKLSRDLKAAAKKRNRIIHGLWTIHEEHPTALLRLDGITDPKLRIEKYELRDFAEIELRLVQQNVDLRRFYESLLPYLQRTEREQRERYWHLSERISDQGDESRRLRQGGSRKSARPAKPRPGKR